MRRGLLEATAPENNDGTIAVPYIILEFFFFLSQVAVG